MVPWTQFNARLDETRAAIARAEREAKLDRAMRTAAPVSATPRSFGPARRRIGLAAIALGQRLAAWGADAGREPAFPA
jgi:hypothetical protein